MAGFFSSGIAPAAHGLCIFCMDNPPAWPPAEPGPRPSALDAWAVVPVPYRLDRRRALVAVVRDPWPAPWWPPGRAPWSAIRSPWTWCSWPRSARPGHLVALPGARFAGRVCVCVCVCVAWSPVFVIQGYKHPGPRRLVRDPLALVALPGARAVVRVAWAVAPGPGGRSTVSCGLQRK